MQYAEGSIISFTPDQGWTLVCHTDAKFWDVPVIGWAVVVFDIEDEQTYTRLRPVVLDESFIAVTLNDYIDDHEVTKYNLQ